MTQAFAWDLPCRNCPTIPQKALRRHWSQCQHAKLNDAAELELGDCPDVSSNGLPALLLNVCNVHVLCGAGPIKAPVDVLLVGLCQRPPLQGPHSLPHLIEC